MGKFSTSTDAELLLLLQRDNHAAFNEIHSRYFAMLYDHALAMLGEPTLAEDIVQDVFVVLWEKRRDLQVMRTLPGYLYGIIRFNVLGKLRKGKYYLRYTQELQKSTDLYTHSADRELLQQERMQQVEDAIAQLPNRMREILNLSREERFTYREIANLLGITENRVKNSVSEAVKILRLKLRMLILCFV